MVLRWGVLAGVVGAATGCGIRWESENTSPRPRPQSEPDPAIAVLQRELVRVQAARRAALASTLPIASALAVAHRRQAEVLTARLTELGADPLPPSATASGTGGPLGTGGASGATSGTGPAATMSGATTVPTAATTPAQQGSATPSGMGGGSRAAATAGSVAASSPTGPATGNGATAGLLAAELAGLDLPGRSEMSMTPGGDLALVAALHAQRAVAATRLGAVLAPWPSPPSVANTDALRLVQATRAAEYGLQVAVAQAEPGKADPVKSAKLRRGLDVLAARLRALQPLAPTPPPAAAGYPLPYPVTTPAEAKQLAGDVLSRLSAATMAGIGSTAEQVEATSTLLGWVVETELIGADWGLPLTPFPGLVLE